MFNYGSGIRPPKFLLFGGKIRIFFGKSVLKKMILPPKKNKKNSFFFSQKIHLYKNVCRYFL